MCPCPQSYSALGSSLALLRPDGVGRLPALGWNSWNAFRCSINESIFLTAANKLVELGLKDVGYTYVNIDDCWSVKEGRDNTTRRLVPDPVKFPDGISGTAAKIHALGLKIGIYSDAGTETCGGYPASIGYESIDAATWAEWGIDYLKYDDCNVPANWTDECHACIPDSSNKHAYVNGSCTNTTGLCPPGYDYSQSNTAKRYRIMRDALEAQNRTIFYSLCEGGQADVQQWGNTTGNSWRMSGDITPHWARVIEILNENSFYLNNVDFWGHSDADMLEVGNGDLTLPETRSHFAFWAAMKSPLLIGTTLETLAQENIDILKNKGLLDFHQDPAYGAPAMPYKWGTNPDWTFNASYPAEYWAGKSQNGTLVLMLNTGNNTVNKTALFSEIPGLEPQGTYKVIDAWSGKSLGCRKGEVIASVDSHDTAVFLIQEGCGCQVEKGADQRKHRTVQWRWWG
ncbi:glycoside hydrolase family 27 protein [Glonium stellatum]|uniref:Alpha-galactosidase n=1 Tax=Glonium stellatum TaxID=574774 RepID=A0A8E2JPY8_9PEZI|nr:glycoside hydrolase family 27 protein [Glonium stellatum]